MSRAVTATLRILGLVVLAGLPSHGQSNERVWGEMWTETVGSATSTGREAQMKEVEFLVNYEFTPKFVGSIDVEFETEESKIELREAYLDTKIGTSALRAGRFCLPFGIYSHAEQTYSGFIEQTLVRSTPVGGIQFTDSDSGLRLDVGKPDSRVSISVLNGGEELSDSDGRKNLLIHLQKYSNGVIVGVSGYQGHTQDAEGFTALGIDWRYSRRAYFIARGEAVGVRVGTRKMIGGYVDFLYHFPAIPKLTALLRVETLSGDTRADSYTMGGKYTLSRDLTLGLNWRHTTSAGDGSSEFLAQLLTVHRI